MCFLVGVNYVFNLSMTLVLSLLGVGFFTLFERKLMGVCQNRTGPFKVGPLGSYQPIMDAMKLMSKESSKVTTTVIVKLVPIVFLTISCIIWLAYPCKWGLFNCSSIIVFILVMMGVSVYGIVAIGWVSKSKYALLGAIRGVSQSISYEVLLALAILGLVWSCNSPSFSALWEFSAYVPLALVFSINFFLCLISLLAESGRVPFDLTEGESEIVAGWNVELGGQYFTLAFLSEQLSVVWCCVLGTGLFMGVSLFLIKFLMLLIIIILARVAFPRMRFDKVMLVCWTLLLPVLIGWNCLLMLTL